MEKQVNLFDILQNPSIGATALYSFIKGYSVHAQRVKSNQISPGLELCFFVLPIVYSHQSRKTFSSHRELYTALTSDRVLTLGLQEKANKMSLQTMEALNLGFGKELFLLDDEHFIVSINNHLYKSGNVLTYMKLQKNEFLKELTKASFTLGGVFARKDPRMLQIELNIKF